MHCSTCLVLMSTVQALAALGAAAAVTLLLSILGRLWRRSSGGGSGTRSGRNAADAGSDDGCLLTVKVAPYRSCDSSTTNGACKL